MRLAGQKALVTGGTSGLGVAIARHFAREGAAVVIGGRDPARGAQAAARSGALLVLGDLSTDAGCVELVSGAVEALGGLTILVNNARSYAAGDPDAAPPGTSPAGGLDGPVTELTWAATEEILRVGVVAAARLCGLAIPYLVEAGGGAIVNISSRAAVRATPGHAAYMASKAGLEALARSVTADFGRAGVRCNTVRPGYVLHETRDARLGAQERRRLAAEQVTRLVTADDVAAAVVYLASPEAEVISGVVLPVDGGSTALRASVVG